MNKYEGECYSMGFNHIAGCDEVGRGPMAGPLVAAAVVLPTHCTIQGINDSKKLSSKKRRELYDEILCVALEVSVVFIEVEEVDRLNVYQASKKAMESCIKQLSSQVDYVLSDAMKLDIPLPYQAIVKGDQKSISIAAASIIAKVSRDQYMEKMHLLYPEYGFHRHKGYVTKEHLLALEQYGPSKIHRYSFTPVKNRINKIE